MHRGGDRGQQEQHREAEHQHVAEPLHVPDQVMEALRDGQLASAARQQQPRPMQPEDLDAAQSPAKPLLLQAFKGERHQPVSERPRLVNADVSVGQHAKTRLRVFGDDIRVPAADRLEGRAADHAHRAREDDRVPVRARGHGDLEEVGVAVVQAAEVLVVGPVAVVLRGLHESDVRVGEVAHHRAKPVGLDHVVRVDDADQLDLLRQPSGCLVQGAGFEPGPVFQVDELEPRPKLLAPGLERGPVLAVGCVVVDDLDDQVGVIEGGQGAERLADHLDWLVVSGNLDRDPGQVGGI